MTGSRLVTVAGAGSLGQASSIKNEALDRGTDEVKGLVELRQRGNERSTADTPLRLRGTLVARDSWFLGYPGRGLSVHPGGVATAEGVGSRSTPASAPTPPAAR